MRPLRNCELTTVSGGDKEGISVAVGLAGGLTGGIEDGLTGIFVGPICTLAMAGIGYTIGLGTGVIHYFLNRSHTSGDTT
ncbi:hypothetical protein GCM10011385_14350 [Nitratireductor aestuarii]|uniref:Uncharacterized protein n=1 Tax=Nitratireductor aestuarii TaxID=1735103 RepID=A0A916W2X7_9HYPH|nr:hypothetical protein GCM10011385_14350 [Nitratireductor aestuarii]